MSRHTGNMHSFSSSARSSSAIKVVLFWTILGNVQSLISVRFPPFHLKPLSAKSSHTSQSAHPSYVDGGSFTIDDDVVSNNICSRRRFGFSAAVFITPFWNAASSSSLESDNSVTKTFLRGTITLQPGIESVEGPNPALYITSRPDRADNVPEAVLKGTRGKTPPVLAARFENPAFPFHFQLTEADLTLEGKGVIGDDASYSEGSRLWWERDDLIVTARLDSDGVAATRDPTDLVGRGFYRRLTAREETFSFQLQGRGIGGKLVTKKSNQ